MALDEGDVLPDLRRLEADYEFIRELGRGAMTAVYLARHRTSGALVAVKAVRGWYRRDATATERFAREARTAARLEHPNIVRTLAVESLDEGALAIVSRYVEGGTLREALRVDGAFPVQRAERVLREMAAALAFAHDQGVVHRDVKPENIFLDRTSGRALLSDFGIARSLDGDSALTAVGAALGTPSYMSPEQIDGLPADGRSDIYSLGVVGWELLSGVRPWAGESLYGVIYKQKREQLPRLTTLRDDIPTPLLYAIEGALQKDRATRWAHVDEFLAQLDERPSTPWVVPAEPGRSNAGRTSTSTPTSTPVIPMAGPDAATPPDAAPRDVDAADVAAARPTSATRPLAPAPAPRRQRRSRALLIGLPLVLAGAGAFALLDRRQERLERSEALFNDSLSVIASGGETTTSRDSTRAPRTTRPAPASAARDSAPARATPARATPAAPTVTTPRPAAPRTTPPTSAARTPAQRTAALPAPPRPTRPAPTPPAEAAPTSRTHADSLERCNGTGAGDQAACLKASLADADRVLNRTYNALIADVRRRDGVRAGADDPASVEDLRVEQRSWMLFRDRACQQEARPSANGIWAPARVQCLARHADRRASELEAMRARLRDR